MKSCGQNIIATTICSIIGIIVISIMFNIDLSKTSSADFIVTVLSLLVTVLLGWNIWSIVDNKGLEKKVQSELDYTHDKIDHDFGLIYGYFAQMLALNICKLEQEALKTLMVEYMINSLKILSKMPNTHNECSSIASSVASTMQATTDVAMSSKDAKNLIERIGEIGNRNEIESINTIKAELYKYIEK